jgi:MFS family permease
MRSLLFVVVSFCITILCWGVYLPTLHVGQEEMSTIEGSPARLRPFVCVGLAYFLVGVIVPAVLLKLRGEKGHWSTTGIIWSLAGGTLGAIGALGIIMAFNFGGRPVYVAPLVFGGAPVVNAFLTIYLARRIREIGPLFLTGLMMVLLGSVTVLWSAPKAARAVDSEGEATASAGESTDSVQSPRDAAPPSAVAGNKFSRFVLQMLSIATTVVSWGSYGVTLHKGQAAMGNSRMRPFLCVGLAYFAIAVVIPFLILTVSPEASAFKPVGTIWSVAAGAAGAIGALGIIMAFNFGGKPVFVMPLVYGGAPVVATLVSTALAGLWENIGPMFLAGLILVIAGAVMVLVFAPKGHAPAAAMPVTPAPEPKQTDEAKGAAT